MGLKRIAIIFNGSLPSQDLVAAFDRSFVRELRPLLLDKEHFDAIYQLDDESPLKPTLASLEAVVRDVTSKFVNGDEVTVFTFVNGHGSSSYQIPASTGWIDGRDFSAVLGKLPSRVSRITTLHACYAGGYAAFGLVDENDALMAYAGGDEKNWTDASGLSILQSGTDPDGDGVFSMREIFWLGQSYIYNKFAAYRRRAVFMRGPRFVDRGLGTEAAAPPFPTSLVTVPDVATYLRLTTMGAKEGVTVIGLEGARGGRALRKKLAAAAARGNGTTQFLWIPKKLSREIAGPGDEEGLSRQSIYKVFYTGSDESLSFTANHDVERILQRLSRGEEIVETK